MTTTASPTTRCRRCRRILTDPDWQAVELGRVCAERLGLQRKRKPTARRPRTEAVAEQVPLFELETEEINEESEEPT